MTVNFNAVRILVIDEQPRDIDHDGKPYVNVDEGVDTILCVDHEGNVYTWTHKASAQNANPRNPSYWPRRHFSRGIPLFRDYWKFLYNRREPLGARYRSIEACKKTTVMPPIGDNDL